ncbi:hypothetical protein MBM09_06300 [Flaviramulus sp. BrNp1-15]|uniref:hypothetical protein n=1 Tax=Flaviramulus sp. BrNp1-15 TaxID=2916754 RepID=UPI001EE97822|nr:hypothetical protein [Flaviramulus sp. BrNp1-15]ULC60598.1 hypothetical protein MBM09_06300 [Flaviramulus sp. BrNp1-15]
MISIKETDLYSEVLKEFNYSFGDVFVFEGFVVSEIKRGKTLNWDDHAKLIVKDVTTYLNTNGEDIIYITNRIHSYSVVATDWLKFFKHSYSLKAYCVVSENKGGVLNLMIEKLFFKNKIKHFENLYAAVNYVKIGLVEVA